MCAARVRKVFAAANAFQRHAAQMQQALQSALAIAARQQPDGSWVNSNPRWMEGDANLVTAYALLALAHCRK